MMRKKKLDNELNTIFFKPTSAQNVKKLCIKMKDYRAQDSNAFNEYLSVFEEIVIVFWIDADSVPFFKMLSENTCWGCVIKYRKHF